ncbi:hypothetical protein QUF61_08295 [Candidatus Venteria ishoeyi]|uniref:leucine-rich repeat domain-containing protein n=1 Tax=Candidatus Venteria ishoeyi TaxID=1899563 RepID=UPI0025A5017A|nr:leucine-rich repeat domain-containing protein [Candidatus Venteria ishoeyi]MDM8546481.1 hypothetical protein [Candidatus Venteria ishoeyi]
MNRPVITFSILLLFFPLLAQASCYYLIDAEGNERSSVFPPYDLSYPADKLSKKEQARRASLGYLIISPDISYCDLRPFQFEQPKSKKPAVSKPAPVTVPPPILPSQKQVPQMPEPLPVEPVPEPAITPIVSPEPTPVIEPAPTVETAVAATPEVEAAQLKMTEAMLEDAIGSMDSALGRKDMQTYQQYLAAQLNIQETTAEGKTRSDDIARDAYVHLLEEQLEKLVHYAIQHEQIKVQIDEDGQSGQVNSTVQVKLEFANGLKSTRRFNETSFFVQEDAQLRLYKVLMQILQEATPAPEAIVAEPATTPLEVTPEIAIEAEQSSAETATTPTIKQAADPTAIAEQPAATQESTATEPAKIGEQVAESAFCKQVSDIPAAACHTLVALFEQTNGPSWRNNNGWKADKKACNWRGVGCQKSQVISLKLPGNRLQGELPDLSVFSHLETLNLAKNKLSGTLPDLGKLDKLKTLILSRNQLSGTWQGLDKLKQLETLKAYHNQFTGKLPAAIAQLSQLKVLELQHNDFHGSLPDMTGLSALEKLNLSHNRLNGALSSIEKLTTLQVLVLNKNKLDGELPDLSTLKRLKSIHLANNQLTGGIPDISSLRWLESLNLAHNQFNGDLPTQLSALQYLKWLQLQHNHFTGPIPDWRVLKRLETLNLADNQLCGSVPEWLLSSSLNAPGSVIELNNNRLSTDNEKLKTLLTQKNKDWEAMQQPSDCANP